MAYPKLFTLIDAIDLKQVNTLRKYILSKVSEQSEAYQILETIIKTKDKREKYPDAESMQIAFYPKIKIKTFINYLSLLYSYAEDWIALAQLEVEDHSKDLLVQRWLNNNGLYSLSDQLVKKVLKKIESSDNLDIYNSKVKSELLYEHLVSTNPVRYEATGKEYLEMIDSLDDYSSSLFYIILSELKNWSTITKMKDEPNISHIKNKLEFAPQTAIVKFAKLAYINCCENNMEIFFEFKNFLFELEFNHKSKFHNIIAGYVIKKGGTLLTQGYHNDYNLILELTKFGLEKGVFFNNGKLSTQTFHNIIARLAIHISFEESVSFIEKWLNKVSTENYEATKSLAFAQVSFYKNRMNEVSKYLWRSDFDNFNQKNLAQGLHLIASFENRKNAEQVYKNAFVSTTNFIERNKDKMSAHLYQSHKNLLQFMKIIDQDGIHEINILDYKIILYKTWCIQYLKNNS